MMQRREFITLLSGAAVTWPLRLYAQAPNLPTIGFLSTGFSRSFATLLEAFQQGLSERGYIKGRNVVVAEHWAEGNYDRLNRLAGNLVEGQVKLIVASGGLLAAKTAMKATSTIPILFVVGSDPVELGLVASLNRPGGNATGASLFSTDLLPKRLELLSWLIAGRQPIGVLLNPQSVTPEIEAEHAKAAAKLKGYEVRLFEANTASEIDAAFKSAAEQRVSAFLVTAAPFFSGQRYRIVELAARYAMPIMYPWREYVDAGGLISYGSELTWGYKLIGEYAGRILKGEKPSDLPVQQPTRFNLIINSKTAKSLGLDIPPMLVAIADEVIE
jgi:putative ABC transport system substrate-binding protein